MPYGFNPQPNACAQVEHRQKIFIICTYCMYMHCMYIHKNWDTQWPTIWVAFHVLTVADTQ